MMNFYIDSDVIVASEIEGEEHHQESKNFMEHVLANKNPDITFTTSVFTFLELASAMIRRTQNSDKAYSLLYRLRNSWKYSIKPYPPIPPKQMTSITRLVDTLIEASIKFRTPSGDTIHAQTAAWLEIGYLVTWNKKHFSHMEQQVDGLKVLDPSEALRELKKSEI